MDATIIEILIKQTGSSSDINSSLEQFGFFFSVSCAILYALDQRLVAAIPFEARHHNFDESVTQIIAL